MKDEMLNSASVGATVAKDADKANVLVVSDNPTVLMYASVMLKDTGLYNVIMESSGEAAVQTAKGMKDELPILLADFNMKGMTGIETAAALTAERPGIKVLLMSDAPTGTLVLNEGWHFLPKPFVASQLCALVTTLAHPERKSRFAK